MAMKKKTKAKKAIAKPLKRKLGPDGRVYILFDRTGSMSSRIEEAVNSTNAYVKALHQSVLTTVARFDSNGPFEVIREGVTAKDYAPIALNEVEPRGNTPLYDAVGKLLDKALADNAKKAVIVVQTDGEENCSKEYSLTAIKARVEAVKKKGWEILFLGNDFDVAGTSRSFGLAASKSMMRSQGNYRDSSMALSLSSRDYFSGVSKDINFTDADKDAAVGKKKKKDKTENS